MALVNLRLTTLKRRALDLQIPMLRAKNTATRFGNLLKEGSIPRGCMPVCKLQLPNPSTLLTTYWNNYLKECGQHLSLLLIDYNLNKYQELNEATGHLVSDEFQIIRNEFCELPELESQLTTTMAEIKANLNRDINELIETQQQPLKRSLDDESTPEPKRPKNSDTPSEKGGLKHLIKQVLGEMTPQQLTPNRNPRGRGRGFRGRGRGQG